MKQVLCILVAVALLLGGCTLGKNQGALGQSGDGPDTLIKWESPALEEHLRQLLRGTPEDLGDGPIRPSQLYGVTSLELGEELALTSLADLRHLRRLEELSLTGVSTADFSPLASLTTLRALRLERCTLGDGLAWTSPDTGKALLTPLQGLEQLTLESCGVRDLTPLEELSALRVLELGGNYITDLAPLSTLTGLEALDLSRNNLEDLSPLAALENLQELRLDVNDGIAAAPESGLTGLEPLSTLTGLEYLSLRECALWAFEPLSGLDNLRYLDISGNEATHIGSVTRLPKLETLVANNNPISDLLPILGLKPWQTVEMRSHRVTVLPEETTLADLSRIRLYRCYADFARVVEGHLTPETLRATSTSGRFRYYEVEDNGFVLDTQSGWVGLVPTGGTFHREELFADGVYYDPADYLHFTPLILDTAATTSPQPYHPTGQERIIQGQVWHDGLGQWVCLSRDPDTNALWLDYYEQHGSYSHSVETPYVQAFTSTTGGPRPVYNDFYLWGDNALFYDFSRYGTWPHQELIFFDVTTGVGRSAPYNFFRAQQDRLVLLSFAYDREENRYIEAELYTGTARTAEARRPIPGQGPVTGGSFTITYDYGANTLTFDNIVIDFDEILNGGEEEQPPAAYTPPAQSSPPTQEPSAQPSAETPADPPVADSGSADQLEPEEELRYIPVRGRDEEHPSLILGPGVPASGQEAGN